MRLRTTVYATLLTIASAAPAGPGTGPFWESVIHDGDHQNDHPILGSFTTAYELKPSEVTMMWMVTPLNHVHHMQSFWLATFKDLVGNGNKHEKMARINAKIKLSLENFDSTNKEDSWEENMKTMSKVVVQDHYKTPQRSKLRTALMNSVANCATDSKCSVSVKASEMMWVEARQIANSQKNNFAEGLQSLVDRCILYNALAAPPIMPSKGVNLLCQEYVESVVFVTESVPEFNIARVRVLSQFNKALQETGPKPYLDEMVDELVDLCIADNQAFIGIFIQYDLGVFLVSSFSTIWEGISKFKFSEAFGEDFQKQFKAMARDAATKMMNSTSAEVVVDAAKKVAADIPGMVSDATAWLSQQVSSWW